VAIVIVGAGDHARVVLEGLRAAGAEVAAIVQPASDLDTGHHVAGLQVVGSLDQPDAWMPSIEAPEFIVAVGNNTMRATAFDRAMSLGMKPATMIHPKAILLAGADVGAGSQVCAGAVVGVDARIGVDVIVNTLASVDHDAVIGDHAFVAPGAHLAGRVEIGPGSHVGIGAAIREGLHVGAGSTVAAGAVVIANVPAGGRVAGVPARPMAEPSPESENP
jgi:sugar O-acyltransferase (sialic acid O-acetyltransferase NeuD family)